METLPQCSAVTRLRLLRTPSCSSSPCLFQSGINPPAPPESDSSGRCDQLLLFPESHQWSRIAPSEDLFHSNEGESVSVLPGGQTWGDLKSPNPVLSWAKYRPRPLIKCSKTYWCSVSPWILWRSDISEYWGTVWISSPRKKLLALPSCQAPAWSTS